MSRIRANQQITIHLNITFLLIVCLLTLEACSASPTYLPSPSPRPTILDDQELRPSIAAPTPSLTNSPEPTPTATANTQYLGLLYGRPLITPTLPPTATEPIPTPTIAAAPDEENSLTAPTGSQEGVSVDISCSQFNAPDDDNTAKEEEYVCFKNESDKQVDMTGWTLHDEYGWTYVFPAFKLKSGEQVRVRTGCGTNSRKDLYWCKDGTAVWNNGGDCVYLSDADGILASQLCY